MTPYETIRSKINEQCPWLMEIDLGCEAHHKNGTEQTKVTIYSCTPNRVVYQRFNGDESADTREVFDRDYTILGRPPELAELLYAIRPGYFVAAHGSICEYGVGGELSSVAYYDLTKSLKENIESNEGLAKFLLEIL